MNRTMKKTLPLLFALALTTVSVWAREISSDEAGRAAAAWARRDTARTSAAVAEVRTAEDADGAPIFHVVRLDGGETVVTSAESGIKPVVAFLEKGDLEENDGNPLWKILAADMSNRLARVSAVRKAGQGTKGMRLLAATVPAADPLAAEEAAWAELLAADEKPEAKKGVRLMAAAIPNASGLSDVRVAPLISTTWEQGGNAANYYTPPGAAGDPDNYVCGCVALAGAQIANYWHFPTASRPQVTRQCYLSDVAANFVSLGGIYDWQNMPTDFSLLSDDQKRAVGRLCYDFGVATKMNWGPLPEGSGTLCILLGEAFKDVFGYASAVAYSHFDGNAMSAELVERAVLASLDAQSPVPLGIAGHTAVADGYGYASGTLYTHINLGWGGVGNAWYNLPEVEVDESGVSYSSSVLDSVVYNIHPTETGELLTGRVLDGNGDPVFNATVVAESGVDTATATTDVHGIYALRVAGDRTWALSVAHGRSYGSGSAYVGSSSSTVCTERTPAGGRVTQGVIGNSWGNDITLGEVTGDLYVDAASGSDANDGRSWATAKATIQAAIDIVEAGANTNALVLVAAGRYEPIVARNDIPFEIRAVDGADTTFIDGSLQWARGVTNRCATLGSATAHTNTVLSGFCLTNGHTPTNGTNAAVSGGGSCCGRLVGCTLIGNAAKNGGGAYRGILENCTLTNNTATSYGGATYFVTLEDCTVTDNSARNGGGVSYGSANRCTIAGNVADYSGGGADYTALTRCIITNNTAGSYGGGAEGTTLKFCTMVGNYAGLSGGGAYNATLDDCTVSHNTAGSYGGGVYGTSYGGVANGCTIMLNTASNGAGSYGATLNSCILWNNTATGSGGGANNGTLNNCTVANNTAAQNGGGTYYAKINNCIVWSNTAASRPAHYGAACRYSCLDGALVAADDGGGNIVTDNPGFVDALHGDFHLLVGSPCIDAGTNEFATTETDFYGDARIVGERVDMGASEYQAQELSGYAAWAAKNGLGAADAVTDGQPNLIRYVFDRPSGAFSPFTDLTFQDGNPVVWFQSFNPDVSDVSLSILSTTNLLDWTHAVEFQLPGPPFDFGGIILQHADTAPARFFKLKAR